MSGSPKHNGKNGGGEDWVTCTAVWGKWTNRYNGVSSGSLRSGLAES